MTTRFHRHYVSQLSDRELVAETHRLAEHERHATANVIAALMEVDERRLYLGEGCSSLFTYCTQMLHFSEHAAYGRIAAARAVRRFPVILDLLADGSLTLTAVGLLAAHLTPENHKLLLAEARHKSKREVEQMVAALRPLPAVPSSVRRLTGTRTTEPQRLAPAQSSGPPEATAAGNCGVAASSPLSGRASSDDVASDAPAAASGEKPMAGGRSEVAHLLSSHPAMPAGKAAVVVPLAPERYKVQVTISREAHDHLRRAQDLLRHAIPNGDPAQIVERALALLVEDLERRKLARTKRPRPSGVQASGSRHVPAAVKREVWARDAGRCAFVGSAGRCVERGFLELHHVVPFADGGATDASNVQLRCRAHNVYEAEEWFGPLVVRERQPDYQSAGYLFEYEPTVHQASKESHIHVRGWTQNSDVPLDAELPVGVDNYRNSVRTHQCVQQIPTSWSPDGIQGCVVFLRHVATGNKIWPLRPYVSNNQEWNTTRRLWRRQMVAVWYRDADGCDVCPLSAFGNQIRQSRGGSSYLLCWFGGRRVRWDISWPRYPRHRLRPAQVSEYSKVQDSLPDRCYVPVGGL